MSSLLFMATMCLVLLLSPGAWAKDPWVYFPPLPVGTVKIYKGLEGGMTVEERVSRLTRNAAEVRVEVTSKVRYIQMPDVTNVSEYGFQEDGKVYKLRSWSSFSRENHIHEPPLLIQNPPLTKGKTWQYRDGTTQATYEVAGFREMQLPAGKFQALVLRKTTVIDFTTRKETQIEEEYYAPGVGFLGNRLYQDREWIWAKQLVEFRQSTGRGHE